MERSADDVTAGSALHRVLRRAGGPELLDTLVSGLSGADLTTLLLEVFRRRAGQLRPADVVRRYGSDRFVEPATADFGALRRAEDAMLAALAGRFEVLALAPLVPLGTHSAVASVDPRNVVATIRGSEVAADPTNGLALEAAARRKRLLASLPRSAEPVRLAAIQRVARAQLVSGPVRFAHFELLGMVTAGRDTGDLSFERENLPDHLLTAVRGLASFGIARCRIAVTILTERFEPVLAAVRDRLGGLPGTEVVAAPERDSGRGYYDGACFKVYAVAGDDPADPIRALAPDGLLEIGDGGFTDWTAQYLGNSKERLLTSGYGMERVALASS